MPICRVFQNPDGTVRVMPLYEKYLIPGETAAQFFTREAAKQPALTGLPFVDVDSTTLPTDSAQQAKWRLQGNQVIVNLALPDPPHPRQILLDDIGRAMTVAELKTLLVRAVRGEP